MGAVECGLLGTAMAHHLTLLTLPCFEFGHDNNFNMRRFAAEIRSGPLPGQKAIPARISIRPASNRPSFRLAHRACSSPARFINCSSSCCYLGLPSWRLRSGAFGTLQNTVRSLYFSRRRLVFPRPPAFALKYMSSRHLNTRPHDDFASSWPPSSSRG